MDFLYSDAVVRAVSTGAVALYQHLGPARHFLLRPVFGLCCNAFGLSNGLLVRCRHRRRRPPRRLTGWDQDVAANLPVTAGSSPVSRTEAARDRHA
jgi:hypothetical protein